MTGCPLSLDCVFQELERKFTQTGAYKNLKRMLDTKNGEIKELRQKLSKLVFDIQKRGFCGGKVFRKVFYNTLKIG